MAKKTENKRCPFQMECERKCECEFHELDCNYYFNNAFGDYIIPDQEEIREARERKEEENRLFSGEFEYHEDVTGEIEHIPIKLLHRHHQNPRKDLGDLTELADSIKAKGVLQNLTVVPYWFETTGVGEDRPDKQAELGYLVVIGNRRLEAAKLAGLETLPCIISNMSKEEQLQTMAVENIQRNDLSAYEQAQCFQLMMDMGSSVANVAERTGFSETTIRRRLNIAKLDQKLLYEKETQEGFQLSLTDLYALEKIKDIKRRNNVLKSAQDGRQIVSLALNEERAERRETNKKVLRELFEALGIKENPDARTELYSSKYEVIKEIDLDKDPPKRIALPKDAEEVMWCETYGSVIKVFRKTKKEDRVLTQAELERRELDSKKRKIETINKNMKKELSLFIADIISGKIEFLSEETAIILLWRALLGTHAYISRSSLYEDITGKKSWELKEDQEAETEKVIARMSIQEQMLRLIRYNNDHLGSTIDYYCKFRSEMASDWNVVVGVLTGYGFVWSDPQFAAVLDGTHELYVKDRDTDSTSDVDEDDEDEYYDGEYGDDGDCTKEETTVDEEETDDAAITAALDEEGAADE